MSDKCPFCGAAKDGYNTRGGNHYKCDTWVDAQGNPDELRSRTCYEAQLAQQAVLLKEAIGLAESVINGRNNIQLLGVSAFSYAYRFAAALLPKLRKATEEKPNAD